MTAIFAKTRTCAAALSLACAFAACGETTTESDLARRHRDAGVHIDAAVKFADASTHPIDAATRPVDAATLPVDAATRPIDAGTRPIDAAMSEPGGTVACYSAGGPNGTCTLPVHCCFDNYTAQHDGACSTSACNYGTITCDGPEDCNSGELCCAHAIRDPDFGTTGYTIACQTGACGNDSLNVELCHPSSGCSNGGSCVTALGNDNDLPRTLDVCE